MSAFKCGMEALEEIKEQDEKRKKREFWNEKDEIKETRMKKSKPK